jgi:uncharacterized membrane protein
LLYSGSLLFGDAPGFISLILSLCGALSIATGGFLGGTLVYRHRVGTEPEK